MASNDERAALLHSDAAAAPQRGGRSLRVVVTVALVCTVLIVVAASVASTGWSGVGGEGAGRTMATVQANLGESWGAHHQWRAGDWWRPGDRSKSSFPNKRTPSQQQKKAEAASPVHAEVAGDIGATAEASPSVGQSRELPPAGGSWKIVAFASENYLDVTKAWYQRLSELGYTEHVIAAMDEGIFDALTKAGYRVEDHIRSPSEAREPGEPVPGWGRHLWKLWRYRLSYALHQTQMGVNLFLVDVDTMWQRHIPLSTLFGGKDAEVDVFLSQGTVYPRDVFDRWGFVACMGTVAFRATERTGEALRAALNDCGDGQCDDQVAMNHALMTTFGVAWDRAAGIGRAPGGESRLTVRMWPKPFVFRSTMQDMTKIGGAGQTAQDLGLGGGAAGTCLGQKVIAGSSASAAAGAASGDAVDFGTPFIAAPTIAKDGEEKLATWKKFNSFCIVISNEKFHLTTLPSAAVDGV